MPSSSARPAARPPASASTSPATGRSAATALAAFTRKVVEEVLETGEDRALEPMGSADRKTVHDTVNEIEGVETTSEGEDPRRYVVIRPA